VLSSGGEVMRRERELRSMHETLRMTVAIPFLFGVPPAYEMLRFRAVDCLVATQRYSQPRLRGGLLGRDATSLSTPSAVWCCGGQTPACKPFCPPVGCLSLCAYIAQLRRA